MSTMDIDRIIWIVFLVLAITTFILWRRNKRKNQPLTVRNESVEETPSKEAVEAKYGEALCRLLGRAAAIDGGVDSTRHAKAEAELKATLGADADLTEFRALLAEAAPPEELAVIAAELGPLCSDAVKEEVFSSVHRVVVDGRPLGPDAGKAIVAVGAGLGLSQAHVLGLIAMLHETQPTAASGFSPTPRDEPSPATGGPVEPMGAMKPAAPSLPEAKGWWVNAGVAIGARYGDDMIPFLDVNSAPNEHGYFTSWISTECSSLAELFKNASRIDILQVRKEEFSTYAFPRPWDVGVEPLTDPSSGNVLAYAAVVHWRTREDETPPDPWFRLGYPSEKEANEAAEALRGGLWGSFSTVTRISVTQTTPPPRAPWLT
jgi:hypothetical protein